MRSSRRRLIGAAAAVVVLVLVVAVVLVRSSGSSDPDYSVPLAEQVIPEEKVTVPDLTGLDFGAVEDQMLFLGLVQQPVGDEDELVTWQAPPVGTVVSQGATVTVGYGDAAVPDGLVTEPDDDSGEVDPVVGDENSFPGAWELSDEERAELEELFPEVTAEPTPDVTSLLLAVRFVPVEDGGASPDRDGQLQFVFTVDDEPFKNVPVDRSGGCQVFEFGLDDPLDPDAVVTVKLVDATGESYGIVSQSAFLWAEGIQAMVDGDPVFGGYSQPVFGLEEDGVGAGCG